MTGLHVSGAEGMYFPNGSSIDSFPRSASNRMPAAVNCLVMEPMRNLVPGVCGIFHSRLAQPALSAKSTVPLFATNTEPMKRSSVDRALRRSRDCLPRGDSKGAIRWGRAANR